GDPPDVLAPEHVVWLPEDASAGTDSRDHGRLDVGYVNEHLKSGVRADRKAHQLLRRIGRRHGNLRRAAPEPDVSRRTVVGQPEVLLEAQRLVERCRLLNVTCIYHWEGTTRHAEHDIR